MNGKDLLNSMTAIDGSYLKEAEEFTKQGGITMKTKNSEQDNPAVKISMWKQIVTTAACFLLCAGVISGGVYTLHQRKNPETMPSAELAETETVSETTEEAFFQPAQTATETFRKSEKNIQPEKQMSSEMPETTPSETELVSETSVPVQTETVLEESQEIQEISEETVSPEIIVQETEAPAPETEPVTEPVQELYFEPAQTDENGLPVLSGFHVKYIDKNGCFDITPEGFPENAVELRTFPRFPTRDTCYHVNYMPENILDSNERKAEDDMGTIAFTRYFHSEDESIKFSIVQTIMTSDVNFSVLDEIPDENLTFYPVTISGHNGYIKTNAKGEIENITWYQDDYSFFIFEDYGVNPREKGIPFHYAEELLKMAESIQITE